MKKKCSILLIGLFTMVCAIGLFASFPNLTRNEVNAEQTAAAPTGPASPMFTIYDYISVTQAGHVFAPDEYIPITVGGIDYQAIYTNHVVTFALNYTPLLGESFTPATNTEQYIYSYKTTEKDPNTGNDVEVTITPKNEFGNPYYVFDASKAEDGIILARFQLKKYGVDTPYILSLAIIDVQNDFNKTDTCLWQYTPFAVEESISAPINGGTYSPMKLYVPSGTEYNPTYVNFEYCGEKYSVYNIDGEFFNSSDNTKIDPSVLAPKTSKHRLATDNYGLIFDKSGTYIIEIYDNSYFSIPNGNYHKYNISISNPASTFYISANTDKGDLIANGQITNDSTIVNFINLQSIYGSIRDENGIEIIKTSRPSISENISTRSFISKSQLVNQYNNKLTFTEDGIFHIVIHGKNYDQVLYEFEFRIISDIRSYFIIGSNEYKITEDSAANQTETFIHKGTIENNYNSEIHGSTDYSVTITIARSEPKIDGVSNNSKVSGKVSLTVYGVGNIIVSISQDGKTQTETYQNGDSLPSFSAKGTYFIKITDEMGSTVTKSFEIATQMNAAATILIVIGAALLAFIFVAIIISRSKIKVR